MIPYVLGFCFDLQKKQVLLIHKKRPDWQKGLLNGIGGKIEVGESIISAMNREFKEETDLEVSWNIRGILKGTNFKCHILSAFDNNIFNFHQMEDEPLMILPVKMIPAMPIIRNLHFLIPMVLYDDTLQYATFKYL